MKLSFSGEADKHQGADGGTYLLQEDKINNKLYWIHQSGYTAIWWDNNFNEWTVGEFEDLGSSRGGIKGPSNNDSPPNQITNGWQYWDRTNWLDTNDVHFEDWTFKQGKFLYLHSKQCKMNYRTIFSTLRKNCQSNPKPSLFSIHILQFCLQQPNWN